MKLDFFLIAEHILAFALHLNIVSEVKNLSLNFKQIWDDVLRYRNFLFG